MGPSEAGAGGAEALVECGGLIPLCGRSAPGPENPAHHDQNPAHPNGSGEDRGARIEGRRTPERRAGDQHASPRSRLSALAGRGWAVSTLCCVVLLTLAGPLAAQETEIPPQAPVAQPETPAVQPPVEVLTPSPAGETPSKPSEPPTGYQPTTPPSVTVTGGVSVPVEGNLLKLDAAFWRVEFEEGQAVSVAARGSVRATYQNFAVTSGAATADLRTKIAKFTDNVVLTIDGQEVHGAELSLNLDTRAWSFTSAQSQLRPELFPQIIRAPVFLSGREITGRADEVVTVTKGGFTTCNLEHPHYFIDAGSATAWPGTKLIARHAVFYALGHRIFRVARIAVPLNRIRGQVNNLTPRLGQNAEEGLFLKTAYSVSATAKNTGNLRLDMMSRKGLGFAFEDHYNLARALGDLYLYQLYDRNRGLNTLTGRFNHRLQLGTTQAVLTSDYRANSYLYAPQTTSLANDLRVTRTKTRASTTFGIRHSIDRGFGRFTNLTSSLQHNLSFGEGGSANIGFDYFRFISPILSGGTLVDAANAQLISRFNLRRQRPRFEWNLRLDKINDLSSEAFIKQAGSRFAGTERLPELELTTSGKQLKKALPFGLPARFDLAVGRYREDLGRVETERAVTGVELPSKVIKLADKLHLAAGGGFRQYFYGDGTAQYSVDAAAQLSRKIGSKSSAALSYRLLRPRGFSPFRFDFIGKYNVLNARLNLQETERFKLSLFSGYNFGQKDFRWQDITTRVLYAPSDRYLIYAATGYDLNRHQWRSLVNQLRLRLPGDFKLDVGSRYDIERSKFASIKAQLDTPIGSKWHVRANSGYNGYTRKLDYQNVQLVRDLHCWELALTWVDQSTFWRERGFRLNLRIKAFPIFESLSVGQSGQLLEDTSVGEVL